MPEVQKLHDNLKEQVRIYAELKELAEIKQQALVANNLHELEAVTVREEQLLLEAARLEKARLLWAEHVGKVMGKAPEEITLTELAERFPELQEVKAELDVVIGKLKDLHELNTQLLQQSMKIVNLTVNLLTQQPGSVYTRPGSKENESLKSAHQVHILDRSV